MFPEIYQQYSSLKEYLNLVFLNDLKGFKYTAAIEHKKYPILAVQFHPEKNWFIWRSDLNIPHSKNDIDLMQFYSNFFVREARKNNNHFRDKKYREQLFYPELSNKID